MDAGLVADRRHQLMQELGHARYGLQGGDWGAIVRTAMVRRHFESVVGLHVNFVLPAPHSPPAGS